jgi:manganese/zinc/iron transport system permease protein
MEAIERLIIGLLMLVMSPEQMNAVLGDVRTVAVIVAALIAFSGALLGVFLLLRRMALTTDAISHTVLLGIVVAFLVMVAGGLAADLSSPLLIAGAAAAGVLTVVLTELVNRSGLVKQDSALGLVFPLLFAVAVILVARFTSNIHLDVDSVMVGEIGMAWADTTSHCFENCEPVTITEDHPLAQFRPQCVNCSTLQISPRDPAAEFIQVCANCGTYTPAQAFREGFTNARPELVFFPKSIGPLLALSLLTAAFVGLLYKELKLSTFDSALARMLGFRPGLLHYGLMVMVSLVAVGAFNAVGSILVVAFFVIPPATLYLLTDRLPVLLLGSPLIGAASAYFGYDLARGSFFGLPVSALLEQIDRTVGLGGYTTWNTSISASIVIMMFVFFVLAWVLSPRYGLIAGSLRRSRQRRLFADQIVLGHIYHHQNKREELDELTVAALHEHFKWSQGRTNAVLARLRSRSLIEMVGPHVHLTPRGVDQLQAFRQDLFSTATA